VLDWGRARPDWAGAVWFRTTGSGSHLTNALDINVLFLASKMIGALAVLAIGGITAITVPVFFAKWGFTTNGHELHEKGTLISANLH